MRDVPATMAEDLEALFRKHGVDRLEKADILGQLAAVAKHTHPGNTVGWLNGGMVYGLAQKTGAVATLKRAAEVLSARHPDGLNYNDTDCDLRGQKFRIPNGCITCSSLVAGIEAKMKSQPKPDKATCLRCKGTGIDPKSFEEAWVIHWQNHGYNRFYAVREDILTTWLHVREMPYNQPKKAVEQAVAGMHAAIQADQYRSDFPMLRYWDSRDDGFVLSLSMDSDPCVNRRHKAAAARQGRSHRAETSSRGIQAILDVAEHFTCVIDSVEKGEGARETGKPTAGSRDRH